jgi:hypothetical protein
MKILDLNLIESEVLRAMSGLKQMTMIGLMRQSFDCIRCADEIERLLRHSKTLPT